ncbi:MAG: phage holin family protein [Eubacteriales bacterium]|nr:phage holin family protein [Eubacteriales bacterium]
MMAVLGVVLNIWFNSFAFTPDILLGGLFSGLASTGLHQIFTRLINSNE